MNEVFDEDQWESHVTVEVADRDEFFAGQLRFVNSEQSVLDDWHPIVYFTEMAEETALATDEDISDYILSLQFERLPKRNETAVEPPSDVTLFVGKVLQLSTAHMPSTSPDFGGMRVEEHAYGYVAWITSEPTRTNDNVPEWLKPIVVLAQSLDCVMIEFDRDNGTLDSLSNWEW